MFKMRFLILYFILTFKTFTKDALSVKIIDGKNATIEELPYQVSLLYKFGHYCVGSIIAVSVILTAAHCFYPPPRYKYAKAKDLTVVVGNTKLRKYSETIQIFDVKYILVHCKFNSRKYESNDIGLAILDGKIKLSESAQIIPLEKKEIDDDTPCIISGWGAIKAWYPLNDTLQVGFTNIFDCEQSQKLICTKGESSTSHGDTGGPLQCNDKLVGVALHGYDQVKIGIFTKVSKYLDFIIDQKCKSVVFYNFGGVSVKILIFFMLHFITFIYM